MMKLNFDQMSRAELKAYILAHRDDDEAFEAFIMTLTSARYAELKHAVAAIPTTDLVHTVEACQRFANLLAGRQGGGERRN